MLWIQNAFACRSKRRMATIENNTSLIGTYESGAVERTQCAPANVTNMRESLAGSDVKLSKKRKIQHEVESTNKVQKIDGTPTVPLRIQLTPACSVRVCAEDIVTAAGCTQYSTIRHGPLGVSLESEHKHSCTLSAEENPYLVTDHATGHTWLEPLAAERLLHIVTCNGEQTTNDITRQLYRKLLMLSANIVIGASLDQGITTKAQCDALLLATHAKMGFGNGLTSDGSYMQFTQADARFINECAGGTTAHVVIAAELNVK